MSSKLKNRIETLMTKEGDAAGMAILCRAADKSERTIRRWLKKGFPTRHDAYTLALACGCTDKEALALARESFPEAKELKPTG